jgi:hypothetical protein
MMPKPVVPRSRTRTSLVRADLPAPWPISSLPGREESQQPKLFGCLDDLRLLTARIDAITEAGTSLLVTGAAGAGVTILLQVAGQHARDAGHNVVISCAFRAEADSEYAGLYQLVQLAVRKVSPVGRTWQRVRATLDPLLERAAVTDNVARLLADLAKSRPLVVLLDDCQYLDRGSREVLISLAPRLTELQVVLLAGGRTVAAGPFDGPGPFVGPGGWLTDWPELRLAPLEPAAARRILDNSPVRLTGRLQERMLAEAQGNPLALHELPLPWLDVAQPGADLLGRFLPLTARLRQAVARDLPLFSSNTRLLALVAALHLGSDGAEILQAAGVLTEQKLTSRAFDPLIADGLLTLGAGQVRFRSELARAAAVQSATLSQVRGAHRALQIVLKQQPASAKWHEAHAVTRPDEEIAARLEVSAAESDRHDDAVDALRRLERAARLSPDPAARARRLVLAGRKAYELGRVELAEHLLDDAERLGLDLASAVELLGWPTVSW